MENKRLNPFKKFWRNNFGRMGNFEKNAAAIIGAAALTIGFCKGYDAYREKQAERREFLESQRGGIEQTVQSETLPGYMRTPTQKDVEPEHWNALQESATNPNYPIADNFDYLPGMDDPTNNVKKVRDLKERLKDVPEVKKSVPKYERPANPREGSYDRNDLNRMLLKEAIVSQESKGKMNSKNIYSGAAGKYQYMPNTALGLVKKAKSEGLAVPYRGRMTAEDMSYTLRTDSKFNEWLFDYDLNEKVEMFDGNPGLIFMSHYTDPIQLKASLQKVYPGVKSYAKIDIEDFAQKRAKMGNKWLVKPQAKDHPSILEYGLAVTNKYEKMLARNN